MSNISWNHINDRTRYQLELNLVSLVHSGWGSCNGSVETSEKGKHERVNIAHSKSSISNLIWDTYWSDQTYMALNLNLLLSVAQQFSQMQRKIKTSVVSVSYHLSPILRYGITERVTYEMELEWYLNQINVGKSWRGWNETHFSVREEKKEKILGKISSKDVELFCPIYPNA